MNKRKSFIIGICILMIFSVFYLIVNKGSGILEYNQPKNGIIPDESTAIKIAEAIGFPIFGKNLKDYRPFHARLENDSIWYVYGLPKRRWLSIQAGGGPAFEIQKKDGKLLKVYIYR